MRLRTSLFAAAPLLFGAATIHAEAPAPPSVPPSAPAPATATLSINLTNFRSDSGKLYILLYHGPEGFMSDDKKAFARTYTTVKDRAAHVEFEDLPPGTYAVVAFHDENDNGKLDTNWIGMPKEGIAASNNARGYFSPPKYKAAKFEVTPPRTEHAIKMVYY
jgi:uncharacterized protein (DUF2141 family)